MVERGVINRESILTALGRALNRSRGVVLTGPRQCGKTTLARELLGSDSVNYFDLEDPASLARLDEPMTALGPLTGLVVIDEVQRRPDLFPVLRVLADRRNLPANFLIFGSASGDLLMQTSESLAGRMEKVTIGGFSLTELGTESERRLWLRGGFPPAYLAPSDTDSATRRKNFIQTLLERDFPQWGLRVPANALQRFWAMLAHYHGHTWNAAEPARALGVNESTTRRYLDLLTDAHMVRQLQPFHANLRKRQVKSPKIYVRDSGLLHILLGIDSLKALLTHPKVAASWEGFVIEQVLAGEPYDEVFFWATHQGAEIDLVLRRGDSLLGVECKRADSPRMTPSIRHALTDLGLSRVAVIYPGSKRFPLGERVGRFHYVLSVVENLSSREPKSERVPSDLLRGAQESSEVINEQMPAPISPDMTAKPEWIRKRQKPGTPEEVAQTRRQYCAATELIDARSFAPVLRAEANTHRTETVAALRGFRCVRTARHKLIDNRNDRCELYDLAADPEELHNIADENKDLRRELLSRLTDRMNEGQWRR